MLKSLELSGFKSFAKKSVIPFNSRITAIVGPNGSGKSNVAEAFRFALGEQSMKSLRSKKTEDLIFNGGENSARANRASVKLVFDNSDKILNVDFDEVSLERVIHRDSTSAYYINGTQVRLKDIIELLAQAHIGVSGHHIISQGEADRILNSNTRERREMIEDALGLKIYQYKREESQRKLLKTRENMSQVELLRKEIAPHLKFLKKQVEKVEKTIALKDELRDFYRDYLYRENTYLKSEEKNINTEKEAPLKRLAELEKALTLTKKALEDSKKEDTYSQELVSVEKRLREARTAKDESAITLGHLEGQISGIKRSLEKAMRMAGAENAGAVPFPAVKKFLTELSEEFEVMIEEPSVATIREFLDKARGWVGEFLTTHEKRGGVSQTDTLSMEEDIRFLETKIKDVQNGLKVATAEEVEAEKAYGSVKATIEKEKDSSRDAERDMFKIMAEENEIRGTLSMIKVREDKLRIEKDNFKREIEEGGILIGHNVFLYESYKPEGDIENEDRPIQEDRRKHVEKIKIRLEDSGGLSADDVMKEYKETDERNEFLSKELIDLEESAKSLEEIINQLEKKLETMFTDGLEKINKQFKEFFNLMFGGGSASLGILKEKKKRRISAEELELMGEIPTEDEGDGEDDEMELGVSIEVNLPRKKIKGLEMLSGGERALTSIALIFAMSQVNPPPFLVLDETDAALDEANSRRYGDMLENLSKKSQLIVVTHNRETMSRAGVLYGVTMGREGFSKLLSIAFDEAVVVAK